MLENFNSPCTPVINFIFGSSTRAVRNNCGVQVGHGRDHEEIGRHNLADVILQEGAPGLRRRLAWAPHVFRDGRLTDVDPELQEFAMHPRRAPTRVRLRHPTNQRADIGGHPRRHRLFQVHHRRKLRRCQAMTVSGLTITSAVGHPAQRRESNDPEPAVRLRERHPPRSGALEHRQLVPQGKYFKLKRGARMRQRSEARRSESSTGMIARPRIHRRP